MSEKLPDFTIANLVSGKIPPRRDGSISDTFDGDCGFVWVNHFPNSNRITIDGELTVAELLALADWAAKGHE